MRTHYLQHVPFEGLGSVAPWLRARGFPVTATRFYEDPTLPDPAAIDLLLVMGGPMSVNDEDPLPWLVAEKRFVRAVITAGAPVLGVCLGAQLIASALGAPVRAAGRKEIGWFPVRGVVPGDGAREAGVFRFPTSIDAFHWHGETFEMPEGAVHLARSDACENQAFQFGRSVIGLQFHLETTPESAREMVENCRHELQPAPTVQDEATILAAGVERYRRINQLMAGILDFLASAARSQGPFTV